MSSIFISYRRDDSRYATGRIFDHLESKFGRDAVFMDIDTIPLGIDYRDFVNEKLRDCQVVLVVIGDNWLLDGQGPSRNTRIEIAAALERGNIPVIPVLVGSATVPSEDQLPADVAPLAYRNGIELRGDRSFDSQMEELMAAIGTVTGLVPLSAAPSQTQAAPAAGAAKPSGGAATRLGRLLLWGLAGVGALVLVVLFVDFGPEPEAANGAAVPAAGPVDDGPEPANLVDGEDFGGPVAPGPIPYEESPGIYTAQESVPEDSMDDVLRALEQGENIDGYFEATAAALSYPTGLDQVNGLNAVLVEGADENGCIQGLLYRSAFEPRWAVQMPPEFEDIYFYREIDRTAAQIVLEDLSEGGELVLDFDEGLVASYEPGQETTDDILYMGNVAGAGDSLSMPADSTAQQEKWQALWELGQWPPQWDREHPAGWQPALPAEHTHRRSETLDCWLAHRGSE